MLYINWEVVPRTRIGRQCKGFPRVGGRCRGSLEKGGKESIKARMLQRVPLVARSSESGKRMHHQDRKSLRC